MKAYITKYALTKGIFEVDCERLSEDRIRVFSVVTQYYSGYDWYYTKEAAIVRAKEMQDAKIKSMEKQLQKLKGLKFI